MSGLVLALEIGGTKLQAALGTRAGEILARDTQHVEDDIGGEQHRHIGHEVDLGVWLDAGQDVVERAADARLQRGHQCRC